MTAAIVLLALAANPNPWEEIDDSDGIRVWVRDVPGGTVREVKAESIVNLPAEKVWSVLRDTSTYVEFMPYLVECAVVGPAGPNALFEYQLIDPPIVDKRDYTLRVVVTEDPERGFWQRRWTPANEAGPAEREGVVRVSVCDGTWTVERLGSQSTRLEYWLYTDPGGSIPTWVANKANTTSVPDLLDAVRKRARDPSWKR